jgi:hypothetical protein
MQFEYEELNGSKSEPVEFPTIGALVAYVGFLDPGMGLIVTQDGKLLETSIPE